jgi:hypothetical protein
MIPNAEYLSKLHLRAGKGSGAEGDRCAIQEVRAWEGLDPSSDDIPKTDCLVIGRLIIGLQDARKSWREAIVPLLPRLVGSRGSLALTRRRSFAAADWAVRNRAPLALDAIGIKDQADILRGLPIINDSDSADAAAYAAARAAADAARAAAAAAAYAAYAYTADAAAYAAARAADAAAAAAAAYAAAYADDAAAAANDPVAIVAFLTSLLDMKEGE